MLCPNALQTTMLLGPLLCLCWTIAHALDWQQEPAIPTVYLLHPPYLQLPYGTREHSACQVFKKRSHGTHERDMAYYCWLKESYSHTIVVDNLTPSKERVPAQTNSTTHLYYLPLLGMGTYPNIDWHKPDSYLETLSHSPFALSSGFLLERVFVVSTFPMMGKQLHSVDSLRNVQDVHHFRSDSMLTANGRDVFLPYLTDYPVTIAPTESFPRKYLLMAALREAGGHSEPRLYRTRLYELIKNTPNSIITRNISQEAFADAYLHADFCAILPGDTPATSKLYKAIVSGCIPVVFVAFPSQLPFSRFLLSWRAFALIYYKDDIFNPIKIADMIQTITRIRNDLPKLLAMKAALRNYSVLFDYAKSDWPSVYHLGLLELQDMLAKDAAILA